MQLAERYADLPVVGDQADLVRHLIGSHHGHARPFVPVCVDDVPPAVSGEHCGVSIQFSAVDRGSALAPHHAASGISERFWRLTRRYGWWGLAYLEAMLRLGDWYGSAIFDSQELSASVLTRAQLCPLRTVQSDAADEEIVLSGIDGANPLGFLAALGTLAALHQEGHGDGRLSWRRVSTWSPVITGVGKLDKHEFARAIEGALRGQDISNDSEQRRQVAQKGFDEAKTMERKAREAVKKRGLRGKERQAAIESEIKPLEEITQAKRNNWLLALKDAVARRELAIGKHINCTAEEYRDDHAAVFLNDANLETREPLDFLAAFASDVCIDNNKRVQTTPFCFITGSGRQYFLDTVRQLMEIVDGDRIAATLFKPWMYSDEKLSMRWDPTEDRRYALMDRDPTANNNKSRTEWMANLLAYRALVMFPSAPRGAALATTAWMKLGDAHFFTWPLWEHPLDVGSIRSLLALEELGKPEPEHSILRQRGILAAFRSRRIRVGNPPLYKINFSPAKGI